MDLSQKGEFTIVVAPQFHFLKMSSSKVAVVDIGSNSTKVLIVSFDSIRPENS